MSAYTPNIIRYYLVRWSVCCSWHMIMLNTLTNEIAGTDFGMKSSKDWAWYHENYSLFDWNSSLTDATRNQPLRYLLFDEKCVRNAFLHTASHFIHSDYTSCLNSFYDFLPATDQNRMFNENFHLFDWPEFHWKNKSFSTLFVLAFILFVW